MTNSPTNDDEDELHQQRLALLGMLAGGVAHDFNNVLTGILGHTAYLSTIMPATGPHRESLRAIEDGARRAASMTQQILKFTRSEDTPQHSEIELNSLLESTCNLLRGAITRQYHLILELPPADLRVRAIESHLTQIIINLVVNARDALQENGEIYVALKQQTILDNEELPLEARGAPIAPGRYATLAVTDNGCGIPEDVQRRIFEPFFSTKGVKGSGLGLAMVYQIVQELGGAIEVASKVGVGTRISVFLPLLEAAPTDRPSNTAAQEQLPGGRERILVVDDETAVRQVLSLALGRLGYHVHAAACASEALQLYRQNPGAFDLVVLDMVMPDGSGRDVFHKMRALNPRQRVLLSTAFSSEEAIRDVLSNGGKGLLRKPFLMEELAHKVRECLE